MIFEFGRLLKKHPVLYNSNRVVIISLVLMLVATTMQIYVKDSGWMGTDINSPTTIIGRISSIPVFFYIYSHLKANKLNLYFEKCGHNSLVIYLVHVPVVSVLRVFLVKLGLTNYFLLLICTAVLAWFISIFACWLTNKQKWIQFIFYPGKIIKL